MKIEQTQMVFNPIRILLETKEEAQAFLEMIDSFEYQSKDQKDLCTKISNAFTNLRVQI